MATPSSAPRPHATSTPTPKANHASTPSTTQLTSPAAVAMARQLSATHRSPSMKTPNHSAHMSVSSQPVATPLGASATPLGHMNLGDDGAGMSSPAAALLAGLGGHGTGLTPGGVLTPLGLGGAGDGLGISNAPDLPMTGTGANPSVKDPEADRDKRLGDIISMLRTRVAGRGVCREAVERMAQLAGFTFLWQDDTLTIAGNSVDLEIDFFPHSERVRDVSLKIAINAEAEAEGKEEASSILKEDLVQDAAIGWKDMEAFSLNLERLGRLDKLSQGEVNCFEAVEGLYESFRKIWAEEKRRLRKLGTLTRLSQGTIGRPLMHRCRRLGLSLEYWASKHTFLELQKGTDDPDAMDTGDDDQTPEQEKGVKIWVGRVECETGYPSIRVSKDWISTDALRNAEADNFNDALQGAWLDPPATLATQNDQEMDSGGSGGDMGESFVPRPPNVRFVFELEPAVILPFQIIPDLFNATGVNYSRESTVTKDVQEYMREWLKESGAASDSSTTTPLTWKKSLQTFNDDGASSENTFSMSLHTLGPIWCSSVQSVNFDHPRQIAAILPTLRQYAMLWTLVKNAITRAKAADLLMNSPHEVQPAQKGQPKKKNNISQQRAKLGALLKEKSSPQITSSIEMSLRIPLDHPPQPLLDVRFSLQRDLSKLARDVSAFGSVTIEVGPNGHVQIVKTENLAFVQSPEEREKLAKILRLSEDIVMMVASIHDRLEQQD